MSVIEVEGLRKRYGGRVAVDDVSFTVAESEIFGIVGPNGAGKTTTVECLLGLRQPDAGRVRVLGHDPHRDPVPVRRSVGVQLQESQLPDRLRVREALNLYASLYPRPADTGELLASFGLQAAGGQPYKALSGGQKQRLSIALALVGNPRAVVLDELSTGLDPAARRSVWRLVRSVRDRGVTVLLVSHLMEEVERLCDRIAVLHLGRLVAVASPAEVIERARAGSDGAKIGSLDDAFLTLTGQDLDELEV